jgi:hypothetical protein
MSANLDVDLDSVVQADIETVKEISQRFPDLFGPDKPARLIYGVPYRNVSASNYTGPRRVAAATLSSPIGKYYDPALQLRQSEIQDNLLKTKLRLQHDGQELEGRFLSYKIVNGRIHALILLHTDTPEKRALADHIGPDRKFNAFSVATSHATVGKEGSVVSGPAKIQHVAITDKPFYNTYIYMAASRDAADQEIAQQQLGMRLLQ